MPDKNLKKPVSEVMERFRPLSQAVRLAAFVVVLAIAAAAGLYDYRRALELHQSNIGSEINVRDAQLRDHLNSREVLARAVGAAFEPEKPITANALQRVDARILRFVPDVISFVWVAKVEREQLLALRDTVRSMGIDRPALLGPRRVELDVDQVQFPLFAVLDILPRTAANLSSVGLALSELPAPRDALIEARRRDDVTATAPLELVQFPGLKATVIYVPVHAVSENAPLIGFLGFSYHFEQLFGKALAKINAPMLAIAIRDVEAPEAGILFSSQQPIEGDLVASSSFVFGGRTFATEYRLPADVQARIWQRSLVIAAITATLLLLSLALTLHLQNGAERLSLALASREEAEQRLRIVVGELNHRVGNIFAVTQAIVGQTLKNDVETRAVLTGRLQSMAKATSFLAETEWRGAPLDDLVRRIGLPFADRVDAEGPDVMLAPGAAQSLVLILHELWTNAAKHGALSNPEGRVKLSWGVDKDQFELNWVERGGPIISALPDRQGFGRQLIERLGPLSVGGAAVLNVQGGSIHYRLVGSVPVLTSKVGTVTG